MARGDQLGRQWKIIQTLVSSRTGKTAAELADIIDCNWRTVYRDLDALQAGGFPIYRDRSEGKNLWMVLDTARQHTPIPLSLPETMALYFSRDMLKVLRGTVFFESLETLFLKIKSMLPPEYIRYLERIEQHLQVGPEPYKNYGAFKDVIQKVSDAAIDGRCIEIEYYTLSRKKRTRRRVAPYKIWFMDKTFYLIGHCMLRNDVRIFALDRIKTVVETGETFEMPEDFSFEHAMKDSFGVFLGDPVKVRIRFDAHAAGYVRERVWHASQEIYEQDDGGIIFEAEVAGTEEIKYWLLKWGSRALVLAPGTLREEIRAEAAAMLKNYNNGRIRST